MPHTENFAKTVTAALALSVAIVNRALDWLDSQLEAIQDNALDRVLRNSRL